jgi:hypothetical protein
MRSHLTEGKLVTTLTWHVKKVEIELELEPEESSG